MAEAHSITVRSCHVNPIFYKLNGQQQHQILHKDSEIQLKHQDKFSLLPNNEFEYEVRIQDDSDMDHDSKAGNLNFAESNLPESSTSGITDDVQAAQIADSTTNPPTSEPSSSTSNQNPEDRKRSLEPDMDVNPKRRKSETSPTSAGEAWLTTKIKPDPDASVASDAGPSSSSDTVAEIGNRITNIKPEPLSQTSADDATVKNEPSTSNIKAEPDTATTPAVKKEPETDKQLRPSCKFGSQCYNNSPQHRSEHAHHRDLDYRRPHYPQAPPETPPCPFGASCYRRNPDHFVRLQHPPSSQYTVAPLTAPVPVPNVVHVVAPNVIPNVFVYMGADGDDDDDFDDSLVKKVEFFFLSSKLF